MPRSLGLKNKSSKQPQRSQQQSTQLFCSVYCTVLYVVIICSFFYPTAFTVHFCVKYRHSLIGTLHCEVTVQHFKNIPTLDTQRQQTNVATCKCILITKMQQHNKLLQQRNYFQYQDLNCYLMLFGSFCTALACMVRKE